MWKNSIHYDFFLNQLYFTICLYLCVYAIICRLTDEKSRHALISTFATCHNERVKKTMLELQKTARTYTQKYICQAHFHPLCEFRGWKMRKSFFINHTFRMLFHVQNMFDSIRITCYITKQILSKVGVWVRKLGGEREKKS